MRGTSLERAIEDCTDCAFDTARLPEALDRLARLFEANGCSFVRNGTPSDRLHLPASPRYSAMVKEFVAEGWASTDHRARRGWPRLKGGGKVLLEHDVSTEDERKELPVYRDLYTRHDLFWWGTVSFQVEGTLWALSFLRSKSSRPFDRHDANKLLRLAPALQRVLRLYSMFQAKHCSSLVEAMQRIDEPAFVATRDLKIVAINRPAEQVLERHFDLRGGFLKPRDHFSAATLAELRRSIAREHGENDGGPFLYRPLGFGRPLLFEVTHRLDAFGGDPVALVITRDLAVQPRVAASRIQAVLDITPAETALAVKLAQGLSLNEAADTIGIRYETARTQLKSMFEKLDCNKQSELIRLIERAGKVGDQTEGAGD